ncbi:cytochrome bd-I ubiquinol oxidase subunit CydA [Enterobacteriaceae endosymbiont of Plateumaris consimilis]|uniref:cytochrome ubiquinol oxidase subunit I n=1 Tax=Enterobacteriaceae endosymbiont of Plateumaris consimilis TaxID=2675794 RepID=UPI0014490634|nr:cytochrome ubiquinol oxidase subunit I [Enterobacteriaceae endosymbiont of Plateumaris consimilis]QJC28618.1 cytochrome bd-I ubiquinol oxidase subunit CydA [Enterobacteriaceae endosymbiont of Plateumaris consimilis]
MLNVIELSRLQFALTAMYHFIFVPLTLGMSFLLAIMETLYVLSGNIIYKDMTQFWGKLFGINFALGVATGLTMEFQFGTNWSYYSHYVGDIFGAPLAIEGLMAFFLESTFVGLFFLGWHHLNKIQHMVVTWLVAIGSNFSALWILIANAWMQNPIASHFNYKNMRMEMDNFWNLIFNPVAQVKFVHTVSAGYTTGAIFIIGISAYYLLKKRDIIFAKKSIIIASSFGLASIFSVIVLGDESGYQMGEVQKTKLAAIEAEWETQKPPASFTIIGFPNQKHQLNKYSIEIPYVLGLIATRSMNTPILGIKDLIKNHELKIHNGLKALIILEKIQNGTANDSNINYFNQIKRDLGYGFLVKQYTNDINHINISQIKKIATNTIPLVAPLFFAFRIMVASSIILLITIILVFINILNNKLVNKKYLLKFCLYIIPLPWIASESGWFVSEYGRQPWAIGEILPTFMAGSSIKMIDVLFSIIIILIFYTILLLIELYLMFKISRIGPSNLNTGRYYFEKKFFSNQL